MLDHGQTWDDLHVFIRSLGYNIEKVDKETNPDYGIFVGRPQ
jgi:hypothetical protein